MKRLDLKKIKHWLNKKAIFNLKNYLSIKTFLFGALFVTATIILYYFLKPIYFDYESNQKIIKEKINQSFQLKLDVDGKILYKVFPTPRLVINNAKLAFGDNPNEAARINYLQLLLVSSKLKKVEDLNFKKILISKQKVEISTKNLKDYFKYYTINKKNSLIVKDSEVFFYDSQGSKVEFKNVNLKENHKKNKHLINGSTNFSENKIKFNFINNFNSEKYFSISVPKLKQSLDIKFDKDSNLQNLSGQLKLKILESIVLLNFKGKDDFIISKSYLRNKFINSKIDGKISFKDIFFLDLKLDVNQINLKRLLTFFPIFNQESISKRVNGKFDILIKSTDSYLGKMKDTKLILLLENGEISIKNAEINLPNESKLKTNLSILSNRSNPTAKFEMNFSTKNANKFFRKFGIYDFDQSQVSFYLVGNISANGKRINFQNIIKDGKQKISRNELKNIEKTFNENVLSNGILGIFDFFKIKKFIKETY
tara:strand:+ start:73 stop:1518 length:1446 start_codon:yes stop_codon:yes gene_type:complete